MTYNVFIVDDEPMIRYGLISCVEWEQEGLHLLGEAGNGQSALEKLREQHIDILITDIKMPVMDGLTLIRQLKTVYPHIQVILISSYSDFEYAREAVKLGVVVDYLLKPTMEPEDLLTILTTCKQNLDRYRKQEETSKKVIDQEYQMKLQRLTKEIKLVLSGAEYAIHWMPQWFEQGVVVAYWQFEYIDKAKLSDETGSMMQLEQVVRELEAWNDKCLHVLIKENAFIMLTSNASSLGASWIEQAHAKLMEQYGISFTVGISPSIYQIQSLYEAQQWAIHALEAAFFQGKGKCYRGKIIASDARQTLSNSNSEDNGDKDRYISLKEQFSQAIAEVNQELSELTLQQIFELWSSGMYDKAEIILHARGLLMMVWSRDYRMSDEQFIQHIVVKLSALEQIDSLQSLKRYMLQELEERWAFQQQLNVIQDDSGSTHLIQLALSYIYENYRTDISLQKVADYVHMSKNYFSEQFKRRTGLNYIDFIIKLRIYYAKQLLLTSNLRVQEIGDQAGFNSPKHFLKLFKREMGCTPGEYRIKKQAKEVEL